MDRVILHADANCFYAAVEMLHRPEYDGQPLAVGGDAEKRHGIILTANYIAKRRGGETRSDLQETRQARRASQRADPVFPPRRFAI